MATQAAPPPPSSDDNPQTPESVQQVNEPTERSPPSVFVNSEPIREDQVQNAIKFLSHPRVRGSPVIHRRSFLEKKGLTKEEIDEAFRRVPDPPPSSEPATMNQEKTDGQMKPSSNVQTQVPQPVAAAPGAVVSRPGVFSPSRYHWYHALLAVGFLAASGAGTVVLIKKSIVPRLKSWIRKVVLEEEEEDGLVKKLNSKPSLAEEAAAAAKSAAAAASDVAKVSQEMLISKNEDRRQFEDLMKLLDMQVREMKSMSNSIHKLEGNTNILGRTNSVDQRDLYNSISKQSFVNGKVDVDTRSVRSISPPAPVEPSTAPHPKSYMEIMSMIQRGEKPSNIRDIDDRPPNPNQPPSNPRLAPRSKPWELDQAQNGYNQVVQSQQAVREALDYKVQDSGLNYLDDETSATPWWQRKNPRITEIDGDNEGKASTFGLKTNENTVQTRTWVPPQPPPVAIPESAEAIRRPKPSAREAAAAAKPEEQTDNQSVTDELQRITKASESGGVIEGNGNVSGINNSEIQVEEEA